MQAWEAIVLFCIALHTACTLRERHKFPALRWLCSDNMHFSGAGVSEGHLWVFVSATFAHADWCHLTNNMLHMAGFAPQLERQIGAANFFALFVATGIGGWLAKLLHAKATYAELYEPVAKYMTAMGSSPATYGLAFSAALLCVPHEPCCEPALGTQRLVPRWAWPALLAVNEWVFAALGKPGGADGDATALPPPLLLLKTVAAISGPILMAALLGGSVLAWLPTYLAFCEQHRLFKRYYLRQTHSGADDWAHFGGALCGILLAFTMQPALAHAHSAGSLAVVALSFAYVAFRAAIHTD